MLVEWALEGTALFGSYSRVVIHTHPQTLSELHRASLPNILLPQQLRKMNSPAQEETPAIAGPQPMISRSPRRPLRPRRKCRSNPDAKDGQNQLPYPARAIIEEQQQAQLQAQHEPLDVSYFDPSSLPQWGGRKTAEPMSDVVFKIVAASLLIMFFLLMYHAGTI